MDTATYHLHVDLTGNRTFGDASEDLSAYWKSLTWQIGAAQPFGDMARTNTAQVVLKNEDNRFSPEHASSLSGFSPGALLRIQSQHAGEAAAQFGQPGIGDGKSAALFDSTDATAIASFVSSGLESAFSGDVGSVSVWLKADADFYASAAAEVLFQLRVNNDNRVNIQKTTTANQIRGVYRAAGSTKNANIDGVSSTDWLHLCITFSDGANADRLRIYLDGVQQGADVTGLGTWAGGTLANATVGAALEDGTAPAQCTLAHLAVWNEELTAAQVLALYANPATQSAQIAATGTPILHAPFSEFTGTTANDLSGNGYHGAYATTTRTRTHFLGWIEPDGIRPQADANGRRETAVSASGFFSKLQEAEAQLPVQEAKRDDEVIIALLDAVTLYPPGLTGWLLNVADYSDLNTTTTLSAGATDYSDLDTGVDIFNYVGDNWEEGVNVMRALQDIAAAHRSFIYENRAGKLVFRSRHYPYLHVAQRGAATLNTADVLAGGTRYAYGGRIANDVTVTGRPRAVSEGVVEVLGTLTNSPKVPREGSLTVTLRYTDDSNNRIGGKDVITPVGGVDFKANKAEDGSKRDKTNKITVTMTDFGNKAEIIFSSIHNRELYILNPAGTGPGAQIRGTKITDFGRTEQTHSDETSIGLYGLQPDRLNLPLLDDDGFAQSLAYWEVYTRKDPLGLVESLRLAGNTSAANLTRALAFTVGDRIAYSEGQTGTDGEYFIRGERHSVRSAREHSVDWILHPAPANNFWLLNTGGYGEIDSATTIGL